MDSEAKAFNSALYTVILDLRSNVLCDSTECHEGIFIHVLLFRNESIYASSPPPFEGNKYLDKFTWCIKFSFWSQIPNTKRHPVFWMHLQFVLVAFQIMLHPIVMKSLESLILKSF